MNSTQYLFPFLFLCETRPKIICFSITKAVLIEVMLQSLEENTFAKNILQHPYYRSTLKNNIYQDGELETQHIHKNTCCCYIFAYMPKKNLCHPENHKTSFLHKCFFPGTPSVLKLVWISYYMYIQAKPGASSITQRLTWEKTYSKIKCQ